MGKEAAETGRALTSKLLRFSPKSNGSESSFHLGKTALTTNWGEKEKM